EGSVLLISGEPGIGKTRLARELMAVAEAERAAVWWGDCYAEGGAPYAPIAQILQTILAHPEQLPLLPETILGELLPLVPSLRSRHPQLVEPPALDPSAAQQRLFESITTLCTALVTPARPLLLVVD